MREFVHESLYARSSGYFASAAERVHRPAAPLEFTAMIGEAEWRQTQAALAAESNAGFLTPVEYFHPWYARAIGRYIVAEHFRRADGDATPLRIVEFGGGNGTCAAGLLCWLRDEYPELYEGCTYELVEISQTMADRQRRRLEESGVMDERCSVSNVSAIDWALARAESMPAARAGGGIPRGQCYVLGLEVLDNLPHDLIRWTARGLEQAVVHTAADGSRTQAWEPATDAPLLTTVRALGLDGRAAWRRTAVARATSHPGLSLLRPLRTASAWLGAIVTREPSAWVPTSASLLVNALLAAEPCHTLVLADFDWLPAQPGSALLAPVVQSKAPGEVTRDRAGRVLDGSDGECDIFFPTDFGALARLYLAAGGARARAVKTRDFMREYAELEGTETRSGYNPLVDDFSNTALFLAHASPDDVAADADAADAAN
jgi:hypothetical protein